MDLDLILTEIYKIPNTSLQQLREHIHVVKYPKGHILLHAHKVENTIYFIKEGLVRAYSDTENNSITFWFGKEGDTIISMRSYIEQQRGYENIELLENSTLYQLNSNKLKDLFQTDIHIANWGRKFAEKELINTEKRLIARQFKTASERYTELLINHPYLIQRVQLSYIASFLGISQVSLSRIRAEKK